MLQESQSQGANVLLQVRRLAGVTCHPWQATFAQADWLELYADKNLNILYLYLFII